MATYEMILNLLHSADADLDIWEEDGDFIEVEVNDFEGFDDNWSEIIRDLENPDLVHEIHEQLKELANEWEDDFYEEFKFDGFEVKWGYASYDI